MKFSEKVGREPQRTQREGEKAGKEAGGGRNKAIKKGKKMLKFLLKRFHVSLCSTPQCATPTSEIKMTPHSARTSPHGNGAQPLINSHKEDVMELRQIPQDAVHSCILMELR